jgi:hypothetical protein
VNWCPDGQLNCGVTAAGAWRTDHRACRGSTQLSTPAEAIALLRSRAYLRLLLVAAIIGLPVAAVTAYIAVGWLDRSAG